MEKTIERKRLELLDETVEHFSRNPRARLGELSTCRYSHRINGGCAIGRNISSELAETLDAQPTNDVESLFHLLPEELVHLGADFLIQLQKLHDRNQNWGVGGLNQCGTYYYEKIKQVFCTLTTV